MKCRIQCYLGYDRFGEIAEEYVRNETASLRRQLAWESTQFFWTKVTLDLLVETKVQEENC